jgi:hypothetical protein
MKERRSCPRAFNEPERTYGFIPDVLSGVFVIVAILMILAIVRVAPVLLAVLISVLVFTGAYWYSRFEIEIKVFVRAFFQSARYTPKRRKVIRLEIK